MRIDIHHHYDQSVTERLDHILRRLNNVEKNIMAKVDELNAKLAELKTSVATELQQVVDALSKPEPDLQPAIDTVQGLIDSLKADDPAPPAPPAEETQPQ